MLKRTGRATPLRFMVCRALFTLFGGVTSVIVFGFVDPEVSLCNNFVMQPFVKHRSMDLPKCCLNVLFSDPFKECFLSSLLTVQRSTYLFILKRHGSICKMSLLLELYELANSVFSHNFIVSQLSLKIEKNIVISACLELQSFINLLLSAFFNISVDIFLLQCCDVEQSLKSLV